jgi:nuclear pore complex protein Nup98-Nup96
LSPPQRIQKVVAPDDEVAEGGYCTIPPIQTVASTTSVSNFVVSRKGYGSISFKQPVDLTGITRLSELREIVEIERGRVTLYPDKSKHAPPGSGLNVPAEVTLECLRPPSDREIDEFTDNLRSKPDTEFVSYNSETGVWVFRVEHFSTVAVWGSDEIQPAVLLSDLCFST